MVLLKYLIHFIAIVCTYSNIYLQRSTLKWRILKRPWLAGRQSHLNAVGFPRREIFWFDNFTVLRLVFSFLTRVCPFPYNNNISTCPRFTDIGTFSLFAEIPLPDFHFFSPPHFSPSPFKTHKPPEVRRASDCNIILN